MTKAGIVFAALGIPVVSVDGGDLFRHQQRTRTKQHLPAHDYDHDAWPFTTRRSFQVTGIAVAATNPIPQAKNRKPFHFRAIALKLDQITLDQVGLSLYRSEVPYPSAQLFATGRISHNGGDGGLIGNNVTIRVRAFASPTAATALQTETNVELPIATPNQVTQIPPDACVVWSSENHIWVDRGGPHAISLVPQGEKFLDCEKLYDYFADITHLQVELEYQRDR